MKRSIAFLGFLLWGCGHDAHRENPVDPSRSPAVSLTVSLDDSLGAAQLSWSAYDGEEPFSAYWVLRREGELARWDSLSSIDDATRTSFTDTSLTANQTYGYRVSVTTGTGFEVTQAEQTTSGFRVDAPVLDAVTVDSLAGTAALRWQAYRGPAFTGYRIERREASAEEWAVVGQASAIADTTFSDTSLQPEVSYIWRIVALGARQEWVSAPSGREQLSLAPVQLSEVVSDSLAGVVQLRWAPYEGPDFEEYRVLRREVGVDREELIEIVEQREVATFNDATALADITYRYRIELVAGGLILAGEGVEGTLRLPRLVVQVAEFDSESATATLRWSPFSGPRLRRYEILRSVGSETRVILPADTAATTFVDSGLVGNAEYGYQVVAVTDRNERMSSDLVAGAIHPLVDTWELPAEEQDYVRLAVNEDGFVEAYLIQPSFTKILTFDRTGGFETVRHIMGDPNNAPSGDGRATSVLNTEEGHWNVVGPQNFLAQSLRVEAIDAAAEGVPLVAEISRVDLVTSLASSDVDVAPHVTLGSFFNDIQGSVVLHSLNVEADESFIEDFVDFPESGSPPLTVGAWAMTGTGRFTHFTKELRLFDDVQLSRELAPWNDFRVAASIGLVAGSDASIEDEIRTVGGQALLSVGHDSLFTLGVRLRCCTIAELSWAGQDDQGDQRTWSQQTLVERPILFSRTQTIYTVVIESSAEGMRVELGSPGRSLTTSDEAIRISSVHRIGETIGVTANERYLAFDSNWRSLSEGEFDSWVGETRTWQHEGERRASLAATFPDLHKVRWGIVISGSRWNTALGQNEVGPHLDPTGGALRYPLSVDSGPSGRLFIADGANHRVVVLDVDGRFITEWGDQGSDPGMFDFGDGSRLTFGQDYRGSIAVDDEGFIYVADPLQGRIQKFAP